MYMLLSRHGKVGQSHDIKIANRSFEIVIEFKYLGTIVTNQNSIQEEINMELNSDNTYYHSVLNILSSRLLSKTVKTNIYKTIMFVYGSVWVWNLFFDIKEGTLKECLRKECRRKYLGRGGMR
jgi:hypothetical protein